ncbi:MAG TPA: uracil-DNA glycosylase family protein [Gemmatimonadales bacterium]|nr:uracil-DNA glycosylase family protein [Gemmatimonadales bacterium]
MGDEWRRYLAQQAELGGAEVILGAPLAKESTATSMPTRRPSTTTPPPSEEARPPKAEAAGAQPVADARAGATGQEAAPDPTKTTASAPSEPNATEPKWKRGAPPIPGPGIVVLSPAPVLLGNDLGMLETLDAIAERIRTTYCCELCPNRTNAVPGEGNPKARMVLVGEGPGATEDATGRPFVGQAGQLLDSILEAIDVPRSSVYITNIVKCRPPQNRKPLPDEIAACIPYLHRQLDLIAPKVIVAMGGTAGEALLGVRKSLGELRGKVHTYNGIPLVVTYHPAALLRNPNWKKPTWDDVRIARQLLDR